MPISMVISVIVIMNGIFAWSLNTQEEIVKRVWGNPQETSFHPVFVAVDSLYHTNVNDTLNHHIQKFTNSIPFIIQYRYEYNDTVEFGRPSGIAVDSSNHVYVVDYLRDFIQKFTNNGTFLTKWENSFGNNDI